MDNLDRNVFNKLKERMGAKFPLLLEGYLRDAKAYMVTIETGISGEGGMAEMIDAAHSLKSASGLLGIMRVSKQAEAIEYAGKTLQEDGAGEASDLEPLYERLQDAFSAVEDDLRAELQKARAA